MDRLGRRPQTPVPGEGSTTSTPVPPGSGSSFAALRPSRQTLCPRPLRSSGTRHLAFISPSCILLMPDGEGQESLSASVLRCERNLPVSRKEDRPCSKPNRAVKPVTVAAETVLSDEIKLEGRLHSTSNIRFNGEMTGDISTEGDLAIGEHGRVKSNVIGRNVFVNGAIEGNVQTAGRLETLATGKVFGDITIGSLIIDEGGILRGMVHDDKSRASASRTEFKAAA